MIVSFANDIGTNVAGALSSMNLWIAICKSVFIILLGFGLTKLKLLPDGTGKVLTKVVMLICLPCLAFSSFMTNITRENFNSALFSFIYGFVVYILFIFLAKLLFIWVKDKDRRKVLEILFVFGSTTFFGQPLIKAVFADAYNDSSLFNVAYRVFLYSYAFYAICGNNSEATEEGKKTFKWATIKPILKKIFVNPIIIATFVGFILWSLQLVGDTSDASQWWVVKVGDSTGAFWNISVSAPWLYQTMNTLGGLSSPLVWIAIGCTLGKVSFKQAASDKMVWIYSFIKLIAGPVLNFVLLLLINLIPGINVTFNTVAATTIMWAVPPATVAVTYCINANKDATFASSCSLIGTFVAVIFIPIYMVLLTLIQTAGIFA
ncbi:MAG TPA: malate permease [Firmicutes bacterium]|nr:malate permease [Bacillota bacterium]